MSINDMVEGLEIPTDQCSWCQEELEEGDKVTMYASNRDYNPNAPHEEFGVERVYGGSCCKRLEIPFPCHGTTEALFITTIDENWEASQVSLIDRSSEDEGVPWDPPNMVKLVTGMDFDIFMDDPSLEHVRMSPIMIYDLLRSWGVKPQTIVNDNGEVTKSEAAIKKLQKKLHSHIDKQAKELQLSE